MGMEQMKHHNIIRAFIYCTCNVDNTMLIALNLRVGQNRKVKYHTAKHLTQFLNYFSMHPKLAKEYQKSYMVLCASLEALYILESEGCCRVVDTNLLLNTGLLVE